MSLSMIAASFRAAFALASRVTGRRATHRYGVVLEGELVVADDPGPVRSPLFSPGATREIVLRHASVRLDDDAAKDVRSATIRIEDARGDSLTLFMHTGSASPFATARQFAEFSAAMLGGEVSLRRFARRNPALYRAAIEGSIRAPSSYAAMAYEQHLALLFVSDARDVSGERAANAMRFRLVPEGVAVEGPPNDPVDRLAVWDFVRAAGERRSPEYLRDELRARLERAPVRFALEASARPFPKDSFDPSLDCSTPWPREGWTRVALVTLRSISDDVAAEALALSPLDLPPYVSWPTSVSADDFASVAALRSKVYPVASAVRRSSPLPRPRPTKFSAYGRLVHASPDAPPIHHADIELWSAYQHDKKRLVARGATDLEGRFSLHFAPPPRTEPDLVLVLVDAEHRADDEGIARPLRRTIATVPAVVDLETPAFHFGTCRVDYFEYDASLPFARAKFADENTLLARFEPGMKRAVVPQNLGRVLVRGAHRAINGRIPSLPTAQQVQASYPESMYARLERAQPGAATSDAVLGDRALNGFSPRIPRRTRGEAGDDQYEIRIDFDELESDDSLEHAGVEARFTLRDGAFVPVHIRWWTRAPGCVEPHAETLGPFEASPGDGRAWTIAKRAFRGCYGLSGVIDTHLARAHLNMEQYALAFFRNVRRNPLRALLVPHLREVSVINRVGERAVFGPSGILTNNSPLTSGSTLERLAREVGRCDWNGFSPRAPLYAGHKYARVANVYWSIVREHVARYFDEHHDAIAFHWAEIVRFSTDLVGRAAAFVPAQARDAFYCRNEIADPSVDRVRVGGVVRAVSPITTRARPESDDLARLEQLARYVIFHCTLYHTWENDLQAEDGGDVAVASLGLPRGALLPDADPNILPTARQSTNQLFYAHGLASKTPGVLVRNELGDVAPRFVALLLARREEFRALDFDVDRIRTRINI